MSTMVGTCLASLESACDCVMSISVLHACVGLGSSCKNLPSSFATMPLVACMPDSHDHILFCTLPCQNVAHRCMVCIGSNQSRLARIMATIAISQILTQNIPSLPIFCVRILAGHMFILYESQEDNKEMYGVEVESPPKIVSWGLHGSPPSHNLRKFVLHAFLEYSPWILDCVSDPQEKQAFCKQKKTHYVHRRLSHIRLQCWCGFGFLL